MSNIFDQDVVRIIDGQEQWFSPDASPFIHGCCDCGLAHDVQFALTDADGNLLEWPEGVRLALLFTRNEQATAELRPVKSADCCT